VYAQPDFKTHTIYATSENTLKNAGYIAVDNHGGFYVADYDNNRLLHFPQTTATGAGLQADKVYGQPDYTTNAVGKDAAGLNRPHGVAIDPNGGLYIADMLNNRVLHYSATSTIADRVYGQIDFTTTDSNPKGLSSSTLYHPQGIAVDSTGLYVVDSSNNRVLHYIPGNPTADRVYGQLDFASTSVQANQGLDNPTAATLDNPTMVALDKQGALYIADRNNNRILYYAPSISLRGNDPSAVRVYGQKGYTTRHSSTTDSTFNGPGAVAVDNTGNVFVLDIFNQRVLKFTTSLHVTGHPPMSIARGSAFEIRVTLQDAGSGITNTDFKGPLTVQIKPGTGRVGAILSGTVTVKAVSGIAIFSGLTINQAGSGYVLTTSSPGYASAETNSFSVSA
jgi:sugar lactone lactonase YvrE